MSYVSQQQEIRNIEVIKLQIQALTDFIAQNQGLITEFNDPTYTKYQNLSRLGTDASTLNSAMIYTQRILNNTMPNYGGVSLYAPNSVVKIHTSVSTPVINLDVINAPTNNTFVDIHSAGLITKVVLTNKLAVNCHFQLETGVGSVGGSIVSTFAHKFKLYNFGEEATNYSKIVYHQIKYTAFKTLIHLTWHVSTSSATLKPTLGYSVSSTGHGTADVSNITWYVMEIGER